MIRGTTPILKFEMPYDKEDILRGFITLTQRGKIICDKGVSDDAITIEDRLLALRLTQEETLKFAENVPIKIQIRLVLSGEIAVACRPITTNADEILRDGVI